MPIINYENLKRFSSNCGAEIPRWLGYRIESLKNRPDESAKFCADYVAQLCEDLIAMGAPGLHFYTMNQTAAVQALCRNLGLQD